MSRQLRKNRTSELRRRPGFEILEARHLLSGGPIITEFMASNDLTLLDGDGNSSDWIELYNPTDTAIDLAAWHLTDDSGDLNQWAFPTGGSIDITLDPDEYLLVFASGQADENYPYDDGSHYHTNFKLSTNGDDQHESVLLVEDDEVTIAHGYYDYPKQVTDVSYGVYLGDTWNTLVGEGAALSYQVPTPGDAPLVPEPGVSEGWTAVGFDDSSWTDTTRIDAAGMIITEIDSAAINFVEIQNASDAVISTAGWAVLVNDASGTINSVNSLPWDLPASVGVGELLYRSDDPGDTGHYWGGDIDWTAGEDGWAMIVDGDGEVVDFACWGYNAAEIASLTFDHGGHTITAAGHWTGDGAVVGDGTGPGEPGPEEDLLVFGSEWSFMHPLNGVDPAIADTDFNTTWMTPIGYDGPAFSKSGSGILGYGTIDYGPLARQIGDPGSGNRRTAYFRRELVLDGNLFNAGVEILSDDGAVIYLDGVEVARNNISAADVYTSFADGSRYADNNVLTEAETRTLTIPDLTAGSHWIAVSVHQRSTTSSDLGFAMRLFGQPATDPGSGLQRTGNSDANVAADFLATDEPGAGTQNPDLVVPLGEITDAVTGIGFCDSQPDFEATILTDTADDMEGVNASLWTRIEFDSGDVSDLQTLTLSMKYDDGFVAYLNGTEVARRNAPATLAYDSEATDEHDNTLAVTYEEIDITPYIGLVQAGTNVWAVHGLNRTAANADFLIQPKLVASGESSAPRYLQAPTPGGPNVPGNKDLGPIISGATHTPNVPDFGEDIVVSINVREGTGTLDHVRLGYRVGFGGHTNVTMLDDGTTGGDALAGDGIYTGTIPAAGGAGPGEMVRWYIEAFDTEGHVSRWPLFQIQGPWNKPQSEEYLGTVVADPTVTSQLPIYQLFIQNTAAADTRSGTRASIFYDGEFYDNVYIRERGNSSSYFPKTNHRIDFNRDHLFRADDSGYRFEEVNLQANMADPAYLRETLEAETFAAAGVPTIHAEQVRLERNGDFFQLAGFVESVDGDFLDRIGLDRDGALYKNPIMLNKYATGGRGPWSDAEKITRNDIDGPKNSTPPDYGMADLKDLVYGINEGESDAARAEYIFDNVDIPAAINYMAIFHVTQEADSMHINVMVYRDTNGTGEWRWLPFDMNFSFGQWFSADFITGNRDNHFGHPFYGAEGFEPDVRNYSFSRLQDAIISTPETREMYLRRLRTLMDEFLQPPDTPVGERYFEGRLDEYQAVMQQDADLDRAVNGHAADFDVPWDWNNLPPMTFSEGIQQIKTDYLDQRRVHLCETHSVDNPLYDPEAPIHIDSPAGIPHAQTGNPTISFGNFEYNPASHNQDEEYIELFNPNDVAADISGWRLAGGVQYTFKPGTVIPSHGTLFVSPNVNAFRARATSPTGGERRFVQGNYQGHLSSFGETITLVAGDDQVVDELTYIGNPSPPQQYLRITEINYHPHPADAARGELEVDENEFEFLELLNTSQDQVLDLAGVHFTEGVVFDFTGSSVTTLAPGEHVLVVKNQAAFESRYGAGLNVAGQYGPGVSLPNGGGNVKLEDPTNSTILDFVYIDSGDWPASAGGNGGTLEVIDTAGDYNDGNNWRSGSEYGGSPGYAGSGPNDDVLINEVLTHTDDPLVDAIELHNPTGSPVDVGGLWLSDSNDDLFKFQIPPGTSIPAGEYVTFYEGHYVDGVMYFAEEEFGGTGEKDFALSGARGDNVWLVSSDGEGNPEQLIDYVQFGAAANGESLGRWPDGNGDLYPMATRTLGEDNTGSGPRVGPVVISEVMYNPPDPDGQGNIDANNLEFIEIYNPGPLAVDLCENYLVDGLWTDCSWTVEGFPFAAGTTLAAGEALVVVSFDPSVETGLLDDFKTHYGLSGSGVQIVGPYQGSLDNRGETVRLMCPDSPPAEDPGFLPYLLEDEVAYDDELDWPADADGQGPSLNRRQIDLWGNAPASWTAADATPGATTLSTLAAVVGRHVFYNDSEFDGQIAAANEDDDLAIATDKTALRQPGQKATSANYTSYSRGINGIMIDIAGLRGVPNAQADFEFLVGGVGSSGPGPEHWTTVPPDPTSITVRPGQGDEGSDRVTLIWEENAIENRWLQVTVKATPATGLDQEDVFYFGNAIGESLDSAAFTFVDGTDFAGARDNTHDSHTPAPIEDRFDYNRDSLVDGTDLAIARDNHTNFLTCLTLITVPPLGGSASSSPSNCSSSPTSERTATIQQSFLERSLADHGLGAGVAVSGSDWPTRLLGDRPYLRPRARQPLDLPQQRTEDIDPQIVSAIFQTLDTDGSAYTSDSGLQPTGDRWLHAVDDHFLNDQSDLFTW